jgi:hypothetical protein
MKNWQFYPLGLKFHLDEIGQFNLNYLTYSYVMISVVFSHNIYNLE